MIGSVNSNSISKLDSEAAANFSSQIKPSKKTFSLPMINSARDDDYQWQDQ
jgi:hypothetical protein